MIYTTTNSEAPVSISTTAYYKGFSMVITKRDPDVKHERLLEEQIKMIDWLIANGFKPSWNEETNKQVLTEGKQDSVSQPSQPVVATNRPDFCPIHNKPMKLRSGKNGGTWYDHRWQDDADVWQQCKGVPAA